MSTKFIKNMNILTLASHDPIFIHMNTIGGEWSYGMAIYDAIKTSPCHVTIVAFSWARSMSSIILQAAHKRVMMPNACFMVHWGTSSVDGHYMAVKSGVEFEVNSEKAMLDIYASRCVDGPYFKNLGMNHQQVSDFIRDKMDRKSDWWLTAQEAVDYGFADSIA
jgi:ATP-dependent Clp protease protease subunit